MARYQNSPRGAFSKKYIDIGGQAIQAASATGLQLPAGLALSGKTSYMTQNSTGVVFPGAVQVSAKKYISANSTAIILSTVAAKPATDNGAAFTMISNSTGVALAVNSTGVTWKYLQVTSVQPT